MRDSLRARITTGNTQLDAIMSGGIPEGNHVLIAGAPGAGKTLSGFEFLYKNALLGKKGLFVALEEGTTAIINNAKDAFTEFDKIDRLIKEQKIIIQEENLEAIIADSQSSEERRYEFTNLMADVVSTIQAEKANCIVIDSVSVFRLLIENPLEYRALTISLLSALKANNATSFSTLEIQDTSTLQSTFYPELFLYDGLIMLHSPMGLSTIVPSIQVVKMRGTEHGFQNVPYKITGKGVKLLGTSGGR